MDELPQVTVRTFGYLYSLRRERGLPAHFDMALPDAGMTAREMAALLELPLDRIEGVFVNHTVRGLDHVIVPGDRVAFVPHGTPGPHRYTLGLYTVGSGADDRQDS